MEEKVDGGDMAVVLYAYNFQVFKQQFPPIFCYFFCWQKALDIWKDNAHPRQLHWENSVYVSTCCAMPVPSRPVFPSFLFALIHTPPASIANETVKLRSHGHNSSAPNYGGDRNNWCL